MDVPPSSEYTELIADCGSGVPICPCLRPMAKDRAEYVEEDADSGLLILPSATVKLPDLEWLLASLEPVAADMFRGCTCGLRFGVDSEGAP
jgi:hypothetical protein